MAGLDWRLTSVGASCVRAPKISCPRFDLDATVTHVHIQHITIRCHCFSFLSFGGNWMIKMSSRSCLRFSQRASRSFASLSCTRSQTSSWTFSQFAAKDARPRIWNGARDRLSHRQSADASSVRPFSSSSALQHGHLQPPKPGEE